MARHVAAKGVDPGAADEAGPGGAEGVHPVAAGGFSAAVAHYARARPAYARAAVGLLAERTRGGRVLDVGAGTGILTGQLLRARRDVWAAEPLAEMLAQLRRSLPSVPAVRARAERLPFSGQSFGAVTVAQAFHWFDAPRALAEIARVIAPGGSLALVFNVRDETVGWVRELTDLIEQRSGGRPYGDEREQPWSEVVAADGRFGAYEAESFPHPVASSPALLAERVRSTSFVAAMEPSGREALVAEVEALVARTPALAGRDAFDYPHTTRVHLWRRA